MRTTILLAGIVSCTIWVGIAHSIEGFEEPFDGSGEFHDIFGRVDGLHIPNWSIFPQDPSDPNELDGTYPVSFASVADGAPASQFEELSVLEFPWDGSFVQRIELRNVRMTSSADDLMGGAFLSFKYVRPATRDSVSLSLGASAGGSGISSRVTGQRKEGYLDHAIGENIALEIVYHEQLAIAELRYDNDISDNQSAVELSTRVFDPEADAESLSSVIIEMGSAEFGTLDVEIDYFRFSGFVEGDFDYNYVLNVDDLEILSTDLDTIELRRDVNGDNEVNSLDLDHWVHDLFNTYYGDANLDGEFNSSDLVSVFHFAQYEDQVSGNSTWDTGDWDLNGDFESGDLVLAFQDAGYENGPRRVAKSVPETSSSPLIPLTAMCVLRRFRYRPHHRA